MSEKRFFVNKISDDSAEIPGEDYNHIVNVLRLKPGDKMFVFNYEHGEFSAVISRIDTTEKIVRVKVLEKIKEREKSSVKITAIISLIKKDKFEFILEKLTELGVDVIIPVSAKRSVVKVKDTEKKSDRWEKIIYKAVKQCGRMSKPALLPLVKDIESLDKFEGARKFFIWEKEEDAFLIDAAGELNREKEIVFITGPEGGFEESESVALQLKGFEPVSIGDTILRAETAVISVAGVLAQAVRRSTWKK